MPWGEPGGHAEEGGGGFSPHQRCFGGRGNHEEGSRPSPRESSFWGVGDKSGVLWPEWSAIAGSDHGGVGTLSGAGTPHTPGRAGLTEEPHGRRASWFRSREVGLQRQSAPRRRGGGAPPKHGREPPGGGGAAPKQVERVGGGSDKKRGGAGSAPKVPRGPEAVRFQRPPRGGDRLGTKKNSSVRAGAPRGAPGGALRGTAVKGRNEGTVRGRPGFSPPPHPRKQPTSGGGPRSVGEPPPPRISRGRAWGTRAPLSQPDRQRGARGGGPGFEKGQRNQARMVGRRDTGPRAGGPMGEHIAGLVVWGESHSLPPRSRVTLGGAGLARRLGLLRVPTSGRGFARW